MADYFAEFWTAFEAVAETAWPDVTVFYRSSQGRMFNSREQIEQLGVVPPFGIFQVGPALPADGGVNNRAHSLSVAVYYVTEGALAAADAGTYRIIERKCEAKCKAMVDAVLDYAGTAFQVMGTEPTVDASDANPANAFFASSGVNLWAGMVNCQFLIGETV